MAIALGVLARSLAKAVVNGLILNRTKAVRDVARFAGSAAWLLGLPAMPDLKRR